MEGLERLVAALLIDCRFDDTNDLLNGNGEDSGVAAVKSGLPLSVAFQVVWIDFRLCNQLGDALVKGLLGNREMREIGGNSGWCSWILDSYASNADVKYRAQLWMGFDLVDQKR